MAAPDERAPESREAREQLDDAPRRDQDAETKTEDDELLESIRGSGASAAKDIDRLERAIEDMRGAKQRIDREDIGRETQQAQQQAIDNLEELLKLLKSQQQKGQSSPQQNQNQGQSQNQRPRGAPRQRNPQGSAGKKSTGTPNDARQGKRSPEKARDSEERAEADRQQAEEEARRLQMIKDVWGHLPPHLRAAMQNAFSEKYLPKYEDLVKNYYEALAEKNKTKRK